MRGCPNMLSAGLGANSCNSSDVLCRKFANQVLSSLKITLVASCELERKLQVCKCDGVPGLLHSESRDAP